MTPETVTLDELDRLEKAAFCAPWVHSRWEVDCPAEEHCGDSHHCETIESPDEYPDGQVVAQVDDNGTINTPGLEDFAKANGQLIAAARNALPELIADVRRLREALVIARAEIEATGEAEGVFFGDRKDVVEVIDAALAGGIR